ncbi:hypothetical protein Lepto7375DRAFT_1046 [Leptolyngbya sp. PCC 7375]|nr:hypothetical protein Lepto7375DRAFT_1046 [Leptolyngbya sp. PCC 7375]
MALSFNTRCMLQIAGGALLTLLAACQSGQPSPRTITIQLLRDSEGRQVTPRRLSGFAQRA